MGIWQKEYCKEDIIDKDENLEELFFEDNVYTKTYQVFYQDMSRVCSIPTQVVATTTLLCYAGI